MFSAKRTLLFLLRTPLVPPPPGPAAMELSTLSHSTSSASTQSLATISAGPSRPRASSRSFSALSIKSGYGYTITPTSTVVNKGSEYEMGVGSKRGYASDKGKKELYSDEAGSIGAGTDDVAHTDAAYDKDANPKSSAKSVEQETGKNFSHNSPASEDLSKGGEQGQQGSEAPLNTGKSDAGKL